MCRLTGSPTDYGGVSDGSDARLVGLHTDRMEPIVAAHLATGPPAPEGGDMTRIEAPVGTITEQLYQTGTAIAPPAVGRIAWRFPDCCSSAARRSEA
jgi:hypothetical protein